MTGPPEEYQDSALRPFVLTQGRAAPSRPLVLDTLLIAVDPPPVPLPVTATRHERALIALCRRLLSLAEAAAHLQLPVSVAAVLADDLIGSGHLTWRSAIPAAARPDTQLLKEVLNGLRRL